MTPIWLDELGQRVPTRPCSNPKCNRPWPVYRHRLRHLIMAGWKPMKPMLVVNWCGHGQEFVPWPEADDYWRLVPVWEPGESTGV
jgi:hypothetical protein